MKALKKAWIFLLLVCLAALFSTAVLADDATSDTCGDNVTWVLNTDTGVLTISGTGDMYIYESDETPSWYAFSDSIKSVVIESGVTSISSWAFSNYRNLTSISMPDSITSIGEGAFNYCVSLSNVEIPAGVTNIEYRTFYQCSGLLNVIIPESVTSIDERAFEGCSSLEFVVVPDGVTSVSDYAFCECTNLQDVVLPDGITEIGEKSFYKCDSLSKIRLPDSLTDIGANAFAYNINLKAIAIPDGVINVGNGAFSGCVSLTSIAFPSGITSIGNLTFYGCSNLNSLILPAGLLQISENAFNYWGITDIYYGGSESDWNAVSGSDMSYFKQATIHYNHDGTLGNGACGSGLTWTLSIGGILIIDGNGALVSSVSSTPWYEYRNYIRTIEIGDGVTYIFSNGVLCNCPLLSKILVSDANKYFCSEDGVLFNLAKTRLVQYPAGKFDSDYAIPEGVTSIDDNAFYGCSSLVNITIPNTVKSIGRYAFVDTGYFNNFDSAGWDADGKALYLDSWLVFVDSMTGDYTIREGTVGLADSIFSGYTDLTSITIPDSVAYMGESAFAFCSSLPNITIPDGVNTLSGSLFYGCENLVSITLPGSITSIESFAFSECSALSDVYYNGSESGWNEIDIDDNGNDILFSVIIHCTSADAAETKATVSETLAAISETATETEIKTAVQAIDADELAAELSADTGDTGVTAQLAALEEQAGVTTSVTVADALAGSFDSSAVTVTGGALNTTTGDAVLTLSAAESADGSAYNNALAFSLTLTGDGVDSHALTVPVKITLPVPATHDPETLVLLHYADGENPVELETTIYESGTQWYVSFVLTSFSDFVMYDSSEVEISTLGDLNGDGEVDAGDLTVLARHVGKVEYITDKTALANADVTGDGVVDAKDLTILAQYVGKIISSLD